MGVLRLDEFMIPKYFLRGYSFLCIHLWVKLMAGFFDLATSPWYAGLATTVLDVSTATTQSQ